MAAAVIGLALSCGPALAQTLPVGWASSDIGAVGVVGMATGVDGTFTIDGGGADVWGAVDALRFTYTRLTGNGSIVAQVATVESVNAWTKAGVMMRESLSANSRHAFMMVSAGNGLAFQRRVTTGGISTHTSGGAGSAPSFVKLTRVDDTITAYRSTDGVSWTTVGSDTIAMASTIYVGLAVNSHDVTNAATATFALSAVANIPGSPLGDDRYRCRGSRRLRDRR